MSADYETPAYLSFLVFGIFTLHWDKFDIFSRFLFYANVPNQKYFAAIKLYFHLQFVSEIITVVCIDINL